MSTKALTLTAIVLVFSACQLQAEVINSSWVGNDGDWWSNPDSWAPPIIPDNHGSTNFAVTMITNERTRVGFSQDITIDQLDCYGDVDLEVGENILQIVNINGLTNHGKLEISGDGLEHAVAGNITNSSGAQMFLGEGVELRGQFNNNGDVFVRSSFGSLSCSKGSIINRGNLLIFDGFLHAEEYDLENVGTGVIKGHGTFFSEKTILNEGGIYAYAGSLDVSSGGSLLNAGVLENYPLSSLHIKPAKDVNNQGMINVNAGGGIGFDCNLVNEPNAVIKLLGGTLAAKTITQKAGATFQGFGGIAGNVVIEPNAVIKLTGPTNIVGDVTIGEGATLDISDGTVLVTGLTTCNGGTIRIKGGTIITQGGTSGVCQTIIVN